MNNEINIIKEFIGIDTCSFLNKSFQNKLTETPNKSILGGPSGWIGQHRYNHKFSNLDGDLTKWPSKILNYESDENYNISIDILRLILHSMTKTVSEYYQEEYVMRSFFYGAMLPGAKNTLHMDNNYLNSNTQTLMPRINSNWDKSGLLYLNDEYTGGDLFFPLQDLKLKPEPGTFIFFEGNETTPHEVQEVTSGVRNNIITFFIKKEMAHNILDWENPDSGEDGPETPLTLDYIYQMNKDLI